MKHWMLMAVAVAGVVLVTAFALDPTRSATADGEKDPTYVGTKDCKSCHFKQFKSYGDSSLKQAFEHLKPGQCATAKKDCGLDPAQDFTKDPKCLKCHTTAYGLASGYPEVVEGKAWTDAQKAAATLNEGVTCEACHGPGSLYIPFKKKNKEYKRAEIVELGAIAPVTADNCAPCHKKECPTMPDDYTFDFEKHKMSESMHKHKKLKHDH